VRCVSNFEKKNEKKDSSMNKSRFFILKTKINSAIFMSLVGLNTLMSFGFPMNPSFTPEAVKQYKTKADAGDAEAQYLYSTALANGKGTAKDLPEAFNYAKKAADQGYERAFLRVGCGYEEGWCMEPNAVKAAKWYRKAAELGDADAQNLLGVCYYNGRGVEEDQVEAVKWFRKAAEQDQIMAQCNLGWCYKKGDGIEKNEEESEKWYSAALQQQEIFQISNHGVGKFIFPSLCLLIAYYVLLFVLFKKYPPFVSFSNLRAKRSKCFRILKQCELGNMLIYTLICLVIFVFLISELPLLKDRLYRVIICECGNRAVFHIQATIALCLIWSFIGDFLLLQDFLKKRKSGNAVEDSKLSFTQYVKVKMIEASQIPVSGLLVMYISYVINESVMQTVVILLAMIVLTVCCWPTRKKFAKLSLLQGEC
jgi:hypothetical protein